MNTKVTTHHPISRPAHYTSHPSGIECIEIVKHMNFCVGNAFKYIWRACIKHCDPIADYMKAIEYLWIEIERLGGARPRCVESLEAECAVLRDRNQHLELMFSAHCEAAKSNQGNN